MTAAPRRREAQSLAVKRAEVEFHSFASLGEPERALRAYREENEKRADFLRRYWDWIGPASPFLEIGANAGHTSYMLVNEFGAEGFALDISADALRWGAVLQERWNLPRAPVRVAADALRLPFRDGSLRMVAAFQMLSQFMDIESVVLEVKRVLAPGGVFVFAEEPLRRLLSLGLYRCPYYESMKPWERRLYHWGLLGFLVRDVIGAGQEESYGIRQNHSLYLRDWHRMLARHFPERRYEVLVRENGALERWLKRIAVRLDPYRSLWRAAHLLGGILAAVCKKEGPAKAVPWAADRFEQVLQCPDCGGEFHRDAREALLCRRCGYQAPLEGGVYNLLASAEKKELYPGDRDDLIDFSRPGHERLLGEGFYQLEGVFGNRYRWMGERARARLVRLSDRPQRLRIRGYAPPEAFRTGKPVWIGVRAGDRELPRKVLERPGLFLYEADLDAGREYLLEIRAGPPWRAPGDDRVLTVNLSMIRLAPRD
ncbi:MAG: methyltransferase domain-containing protein [Bryobacterales bacterium]|nr:methyltransferase domain-containing protein [Bryobacteraceae bacterium]MDW8131028.1 methyltransferase domain-containing protein [Bryobacterales bacterium]